MQPCCTVREVTVCVTVHCDAAREWGGNELTTLVPGWPRCSAAQTVHIRLQYLERHSGRLVGRRQPAHLLLLSGTIITPRRRGFFCTRTSPSVGLDNPKKKTGAPVFFSRIDRSAHHQTHEVAECTKVPWADSRLPDSTSSLPRARSVIYSRYLPTYISYSGR